MFLNGLLSCSKKSDSHKFANDNTIAAMYNILTLKVPTQQNGQTHSNNSSAIADEWFECVCPFRGVGT